MSIFVESQYPNISYRHVWKQSWYWSSLVNNANKILSISATTNILRVQTEIRRPTTIESQFTCEMINPIVILCWLIITLWYFVLHMCRPNINIPPENFYDVKPRCFKYCDCDQRKYFHCNKIWRHVIKNNDFDKPAICFLLMPHPFEWKVCVILINWTSISFGFVQREKSIKTYNNSCKGC